MTPNVSMYRTSETEKVNTVARREVEERDVTTLVTAILATSR
jgi:hypothetical protein